jgi:hypothetical protein
VQFLLQNQASAEKSLRNFQADFIKRHVPSGASGEVFRAAQRFANFAAAGELATEAGLTGWEPEEAVYAAVSCFESWLASRGTIGGTDMASALKQVRHFLEAHGASRFQKIGNLSNGASGDPRIINRAGFVRSASGETEYLVLKETFKAEVCSGYDHREVLRELNEKGLLIREMPAMTIKTRLPELGSVRVYCIRAAILDT